LDKKCGGRFAIGRISADCKSAATFCFVTHEEVAMNGNAGPPSTSPVAPGQTVFVVEDDDAVRKSLSDFLEKMGYQILTAKNGEEALHVSDLHQGEIDVLVTDVVMPRMSGQELALRLLARFPGLKVVFMSGYTAAESELHGLLDPALPFLPKPFSPLVLAEALRQLLEKPDDQTSKETSQ
jgi:DNA-binding NtrC family response regulator